MARTMYAIFSTSSLAPFLRNERAATDRGREKTLIYLEKYRFPVGGGGGKG
jgi:hypothetical protein